MIHKCNCTCDSRFNTAGVEYQDSVYGRGMRVHNPRGKGHEKEISCTVCGANKTISVTVAAAPEVKKKKK